MVVALPPFQRLIDDHAAGVHRFLVGSVGRIDADDCFQETFLAALRGYPELRSAENLRGWLFTIAARKAVDHHRARNRRPVPVELVPEREGGSEPDAAGIALWEAVAGLAPKQREAVIRRVAAGQPHEEIAAAMGISTVAARRNAHDGVRRLRERWTT